MKPTPTPEMIEAGARAVAKVMTEKRNEIYRLQGREKLVLTDEEIANSVERSWRLHKQDTEAALSAALSVPAAAVVGEPVAWLHPTANWSDVDRQKVLNHCVKDGDMPVPLYAAPSSTDGWQPIETAPKEMEPLLLWQEQWLNPVMGRWSDARNGWIEYGSRDIKANIATHWRPLPAPPAAGGASHE